MEAAAAAAKDRAEREAQLLKGILEEEQGMDMLEAMVQLLLTALVVVGEAQEQQEAA